MRILDPVPSQSRGPVLSHSGEPVLSLPKEPAQLDPHDFPTYQAYQTARTRELTRARIRNMRATNRHLSLAEIAYHTGVSTAEVEAALAPDR